MASIPLQRSSGKPQENVQERFRQLAETWHEDTDFLSSMTEAENHHAYQDIIKLGPQVLPFLLRDLEENHTHWFGALEAITGANPVSPEIAGQISKMADVWLDWARDKGYQW